jgi:hypothetical protein
MTRLTFISLLALFLAAGGCASEPRSGTMHQPALRSSDPLNPVDAFPQARGASAYMRQ